MPNIKTVWTAVFVTIVLCLSSCKPLPAVSLTPTATVVAVSNTPRSSANTSQPLLKTTMGDFVIVSARLVDEVQKVKPLAGEKFLLVTLAKPGLVKLVFGEFSLETFGNIIHDSNDEIYILGNDGSRTFSTGMCGWIDDEFVMGFMVPLVDTYTLYWPENSPIDLNIEK